eukprot:6305238-Amphidinium_carterae.1
MVDFLAPVAPPLAAASSSAEPRGIVVVRRFFDSKNDLMARLRWCIDAGYADEHDRCSTITSPCPPERMKTNAMKLQLLAQSF